MNFIEDKTFKKVDYNAQNIEVATYEYCKFEQCNFESTVLNNIKFIDCEFVHCNLSLAKIENTMFQDCKFNNCKMLGLQFPTANLFNIGFMFVESVLDHCNFSGLRLNKIKFSSCRMQEIDFENAELKEAKFDNCDLLRATFFHSNLEKSDFSTAYNFQLEPDANRIAGAKFDLQSLPALLTKYKLNIVGCDR